MLDWDRRYLWAAAGLLLILVFAGGMKYMELRNRGQTERAIVSAQAAGEAEAQKKKGADIIQVYVTGAVLNPGVYQLPTEARVYEAVNMAQALPSANLRQINLALKLEDGQAIVVPAEGEEAPSPLGGGSGSGIGATGLGQNGKVNINTASAPELDEKLPGIGPTLAQRIVEYRSSHGGFKQVEDLNEVSGIGDKKFADIQDLITVR